MVRQLRARIDNSTRADDGNDGAEAKFLGVCKPSPVSVSVATPAPQAAAARDAVLDEWVREHPWPLSLSLCLCLSLLRLLRLATKRYSQGAPAW